MKVFDWLEATTPNKKGITRNDRTRLAALRLRVFTAAKTNAQTLAGAKTRGAIGRGLIERLALATKNEPELQKSDMIITWEDEVTEISDEKAA